MIPNDDDGAAIIPVAARHGFSPEAGAAMAAALAAGGGSMAQFSHPELGGMGQWSSGGMLMIGRMGDHALKARVASLAAELADMVRNGTIQSAAGRLASVDANAAEAGTGGSPCGTDASGGWWPEEFGSPAAGGAQNGCRYAVFPALRRLAVERDGRLSVHDTGDHRIAGASQRQGGTSRLRFSSQLGSVALEALPEVAVKGAATPEAAPETGPAGGSGADPLDTIRRLADLRDQGLLTGREFDLKKAELLGRI